ncbi:hypothetical protein J8J20_25705 [Mycobacterium tuberculosis]|nr:hypothetical protein [Mycobacterium tuberculosis]
MKLKDIVIGQYVERADHPGLGGYVTGIAATSVRVSWEDAGTMPTERVEDRRVAGEWKSGDGAAGMEAIDIE